MSWHSLLQALDDSAIGSGIRESSVLFPSIETIHVLMATTVVGTIAIVDLRLIGYGAHRRGARRLITELLPFTWVAFALAAVTGSLLFTSNATGYAANVQFLTKMALLLLAGINMAVFHMSAYRRIADWDETLPPPTGVRIAGATSLMLWILVVFFARWIGFTVG
jgi:hypothetical protein